MNNSNIESLFKNIATEPTNILSKISTLLFFVQKKKLNIHENINYLIQKLIECQNIYPELNISTDTPYGTLTLSLHQNIYLLNNLVNDQDKINGYISRGCILFYMDSDKITILNKKHNTSVPPIFNYISNINATLQLVSTSSEFAEPIYILDDMTINPVPIKIVNKKIIIEINPEYISNSSISANILSTAAIHIDATY